MGNGKLVGKPGGSGTPGANGPGGKGNPAGGGNGILGICIEGILGLLLGVPLCPPCELFISKKYYCTGQGDANQLSILDYM